MDDRTMIVVRAFRGLDKEAEGNCAIPPQFRSKLDNKAAKKKRAKKTVKEALAGNTSDKVIDVEVERIDDATIKAAKDAITVMQDLREDADDALKNNPFLRRPSGVLNSKVAEVGALRSKARSEQKKQEQIEALGNTLGKSAVADPYQHMRPELQQRLGMDPISRISSTLGGLVGGGKPKEDAAATAGATGGTGGGAGVLSAISPFLKRVFQPKVLHAKTAAEGGAAATGQDPYQTMQDMMEDGRTVSKAIPGLDPTVVLQGQQMGVDMSPGAIKKRLGAHEMISRGKKILRDDNQNGVPDAMEQSQGAVQAAAGGGVPQEVLAAQGQQNQPQQAPGQQPPMVAAAKLRTEEIVKTAMPAAAAPAAAAPAAAAPAGPSHAEILRWARLKQYLPKGVFHVGGGKYVSQSDLAHMAGQEKTPAKTDPQSLYDATVAGHAKSAKNWIAGAVKKPGALHKQMGIPEDEKIPAGKLEAAAKKPGKLGQRARLAETFKKMDKKSVIAAVDQLLKASKQDADSKEKEQPTKPGVVKLESASDTPPKKAPEKKPEKESENEAETKQANLAKILTGLTSKGVGMLSRIGGVPLKGAGKGIEFVGKKIVPKMPGLGTKIQRTGEKVTGAGKFSSLVGRGFGRVGKKLIRDQAPSTGMGMKVTADMIQKLVGKDPEWLQLAKIYAPAALGAGVVGKGVQTLAGGDDEEKEAADMGAGAKPLKTSHDLPKRDGFKSTNRQQVFNDVARWSLGARM